ncbi:hypothetical protein CHUAL_003023 [Chamberlinius hualienensis]
MSIGSAVDMSVDSALDISADSVEMYIEPVVDMSIDSLVDMSIDSIVDKPVETAATISVNPVFKMFADIAIDMLVISVADFSEESVADMPSDPVFDVTIFEASENIFLNISVVGVSFGSVFDTSNGTAPDDAVADISSASVFDMFFKLKSEMCVDSVAGTSGSTAFEVGDDIVFETIVDSGMPVDTIFKLFAVDITIGISAGRAAEVSANVLSDDIFAISAEVILDTTTDDSDTLIDSFVIELLYQMVVVNGDESTVGCSFFIDVMSLFGLVFIDSVDMLVGSNIILSVIGRAGSVIVVSVDFKSTNEENSANDLVIDLSDTLADNLVNFVNIDVNDFLFTDVKDAVVDLLRS